MHPRDPNYPIIWGLFGNSLLNHYGDKETLPQLLETYESHGLEPSELKAESRMFLDDDEEQTLKIGRGKYCCFIRVNDIGYEYTIFDSGYSEVYGGFLKEPYESISESIQSILNDNDMTPFAKKRCDPEYLLETGRRGVCYKHYGRKNKNSNSTGRSNQSRRAKMVRQEWRRAFFGAIQNADPMISEQGGMIGWPGYSTTIYIAFPLVMKGITFM